MSDEKPKTIKVPVAVMADLLQGAAEGLYAEDPSHEIEMQRLDFLIMGVLIMRGVKCNPEPVVGRAAIETLERLRGEDEHLPETN